MEGTDERQIGVPWWVYACAYGVIGRLGRAWVLAMSKNYRFVRRVLTVRVSLPSIHVDLRKRMYKTGSEVASGAYSF